MKDKKFRILCILGAVWALLFLITMRTKAPLLEGVEMMVSFSCIAWFAYWTFSLIRWTKKPEPKKESEQPNADTKKETASK
jgi:tellurite resistance protein TehA-like permease